MSKDKRKRNRIQERVEGSEVMRFTARNDYAFKKLFGRVENIIFLINRSFPRLKAFLHRTLLRPHLSAFKKPYTSILLCFSHFPANTPHKSR